MSVLDTQNFVAFNPLQNNNHIAVRRRKLMAKKITKPETKTVTRTVAIPKTRIVKQQTPPQTIPKDTERTDFTPIRPQQPLPNQRNQKVTIVKTVKTARFVAVWQCG
ncbi:hypothetical protein N8390_10500 [Amylibacter sp.]|nr:hypothetical protein [Amylibacter sp.]